MELEKVAALDKYFQTFDQKLCGKWCSDPLWFDNWHPLFDTYSYNIFYASGIPITATLSTVICNGSWAWPPVRSPALLDIQNSLSCILPSSRPDTFIWVPTNSSRFHFGATWKSIRAPYPKVLCFSLIWFKGLTPKHSFICWLAMLNRLTTCIRQRKYNAAINLNCVFCGLMSHENTFSFLALTPLTYGSILPPHYAPPH